MDINREIKKKYYLIYWLNNGSDVFNVKECVGDSEMEIEVEKLKNMYYNYLISEHLENVKYANNNKQYKIHKRGNFPSIKRLHFLSSFILFLVLICFLILLYNRLK